MVAFPKRKDEIFTKNEGGTRKGSGERSHDRFSHPNDEIRKSKNSSHGVNRINLGSLRKSSNFKKRDSSQNSLSQDQSSDGEDDS